MAQSIDEDINIRKNNGRGKRFIDAFVDFKKFVSFEFQNINQKIANLNMKDQFSQGNTLNEQQKQCKEGNNSPKINRNSTNRYQPMTFRNKFQPIYTKPIDLKEDDSYTIDLQRNNLATQSTWIPSPVVNIYLDRDLLHCHIRNATIYIVPGNTDSNNDVEFGREAHILGTSTIKGIQRKEFNAKLNKYSNRLRPLIGTNGEIWEANLKRSHIGCVNTSHWLQR